MHLRLSEKLFFVTFCLLFCLLHMINVISQVYAYMCKYKSPEWTYVVVLRPQTNYSYTTKVISVFNKTTKTAHISSLGTVVDMCSCYMLLLSICMTHCLVIKSGNVIINLHNPPTTVSDLKGN